MRRGPPERRFPLRRWGSVIPPPAARCMLRGAGMRSTRRSRWLALLLPLPLLGLCGCPSVDFTERRRLADPIMRFDEGPCEAHLYQKTYYSREASVGGFGSSAGGGCGCY